MKVNDPGSNPLGATQIGGARPAETGLDKTGRQPDSLTTAKDEVSLSDLSGRLRELDSESPERAARLERLAAEVKSGRYNVDPAEVSHRIVNDALKGPE